METAPRKSIAEQIFGDNKAPIEEVIATDFAAIFAEADALAAEVKARPTKIKDDADFAQLGAVASKVKDLVNRLHQQRVDETNLFRQAGIKTKAAFDVFIDKLTAAFDAHQLAADAYTTEKAAKDRRLREAAALKAREAEEKEREKARSKDVSAGVAARAEGRAEALAAQAEKLEQGKTTADAVRVSGGGGSVATATTGYDFSVADYAALDLNQLRAFLSETVIDAAIRQAVRVHKDRTNLAGVKVFPKTKALFRG